MHDELLPEDWAFLLCVKDILAPFKEWTLRLQVRYSNGCVSDILPAMDELLAHLEDLKVQFVEEPHLLTMIINGWSIMDKYHSLPLPHPLLRNLPPGKTPFDRIPRYYSKMDLCPAYAIAVALHPNMKLAYFREEWATKPDWVAGAVEAIEHRWHESYRGYSAAHPDERQVEELEAGAEEGHPLSRWGQEASCSQSTERNRRHDGSFSTRPTVERAGVILVRQVHGSPLA